MSSDIDINIKTLDDLISQAYANRKAPSQNTSEIAEEIIKHSVSISYAKGIASGYFLKGYALSENSDYFSARSLFHGAVSIFEKINDEIWLARSYYIIGATHYYTGEFDKALEFNSLSFDLHLKNNDKEGIALNYNGWAITYMELGDYPATIENSEKALSIFKELNYESSIAMMYNNMGTMYYRLRDYDKALELYNCSKEMCERLNNMTLYTLTLNNISLIYTHQEKHEQCVQINLEALKIQREINNKRGEANSLGKLGGTYTELNLNDKAIECFNESIKICNTIGDKKGESLASLDLGMLYKKLNEPLKARTCVENALKTASTPNHLAGCHLFYSELFEEAGEYVKSLEQYKLYNENVLLQSDEQLKNLKLLFEDKKKYLSAMHKLALLKRESDALSEKNSALNELNQQLNLKNNTLSDTLNTLRSQSSEIRRINDINTKILSILAHDLRNPLGIVQQVISMYIDKVIDQEMIDEIFKELQKNSTAALNMLNEVLHWGTSQVEKEMAADLVNINLYNLIEGKRNEFSLLLKSKNNILENLCDENSVFKADSNMLSVIMRNLIVNANKFTRDGKIIVNSINDTNFVQVTVSDTGIGMKPTQVQRLFNWETRESSEGTSGEKGTGLGLLLCSEFIRAHNGKIWVESEQNKGSSFHFTISKNL
ncbi:MAG: tetratricopeptide repeat-containing sensor histidine kinase [Bacteroidetes bacterium]|nr:tetratricopeptide repeat-containing sensor histidine kinase [Bacteroidota bacterium]